MVSKEKFTEQTINIINDFKNKLDNRAKVDSRSVVDTFNYLFEGVKQKQPYTQCGSCIKRCITDMWNELKSYENALETLVEALDEELLTDDETEPQKPLKRAKKA